MSSFKITVVAGILFSAGMAAAQVPYTFSAGAPAKAAEVNANFDYLSGQIAGKVSAFTALGHGNPPSIAALTFLAPTVTVTVSSTSQKLLVLSMKVVGTLDVGGSGLWSVNICYRQTGSSELHYAIQSPTNPVPDWTPYMALPQGSFLPISLSALLTSLAPATYEVGLCGAPVGTPTTNTLQYNTAGGNGYTNVVFLN